MPGRPAKNRPRFLGPCLFASGMLLTSHASASPPFELMGGVGGTGGLQARTVPGGAASAYFNPALLVDTPAGLTFGFVVVSQQIGISLDPRPPGFAVPDGTANAEHADGSRWGNYPIATNLLQNGRTADASHDALPARPRQGDGSGHGVLSYEVIGLVGKLFHDRLTLGLYGMIPNGDFTNLNAFYNDEREQYFSNSLHPELYSDRLSALSIAFGAGFKVTDALSVGLAATLSLKANVGAPTYVVDAGRLQDILIDSNASVNMSIAPHLGVSYEPTPRLRLTGTVHSPEKVELGANFTFLLANGIQQSSGVTWVHDYMPWRIGAGASYDLWKEDDQALTVAATAVYGKWSDYVDRHGETPVPAYGWYDTISPAAGLRFQRGPVGTFLDAQFQPTPVPLQTGRTNYVDNDRASLAIGVEYQFSFAGTPMRFGAQTQAHWLIPRHQTKLPTPTTSDGQNHTPALVADEVPDDAELSGEPLAGHDGLQTNNPGFPGFGSQGWILGGGLYFAVTP